MNANPRPVGVTVLVVLLWIQAVFGILVGLFFILEQNDASIIRHTGESSGTLAAIGWASVVVGLITAAVAAALGAGSNFIRWVAGVITVLNLIASVYSVIAIDGVTRGQALVNALVALAVLYILFGERGSKEFFEGRTA